MKTEKTILSKLQSRIDQRSNAITNLEEQLEEEGRAGSHARDLMGAIELFAEDQRLDKKLFQHILQLEGALKWHVKELAGMYENVGP